MTVGTAHGEQPDSRVTVLTEAGLAAMFADEGRPIVLHDGRYWQSPVPGFYQPLHLLGPMRAAHVSRPALLCWGYRTALNEHDAHSASGSIPVYLLTDVEHYTEELLGRGRRSDLHKARRQVEFVQLRDPALLLEQGYGAFVSHKRRLGYRRLLAKTDYSRAVQRRAVDGRRLVIAGLVDGRLGGYCENYAVDGVVYLENLYVATDVLRTGIATGLYVETLRACARAGTIHSACCGLHRLENADLSSFKASFGFRVAQVPARVVVPAPIRVAIYSLRPATGYRLMGVSPQANAGA